MRIRELRLARGLNQSQVAEATGVTPQAVCRWEAGVATPTTDKLPLMADLFGCTIDALYGREPPALPPGEAAS